MNHKLLSYLAITAAVCLAYPGIASACDCSGSTWFTMSQDNVNVYATATVSVESGCDPSAFATITAPDNTTASGGGDVSGHSQHRQRY